MDLGIEGCAQDLESSSAAAAAEQQQQQGPTGVSLDHVLLVEYRAWGERVVAGILGDEAGFRGWCGLRAERHIMCSR